MSTMAGGSSRESGRRRPPRAWLTDIPVGVGLLAGFFSIPAGTLGHVAVGLLFVAVVVVHLATRPGPASTVWRPASRTGRTVRLRLTLYTAMAGAAVMTVSGFVQWAGVRGAIPVHSTSSFVTLLAGAAHLWQYRRPLASRLRGPARAEWH